MRKVVFLDIDGPMNTRNNMLACKEDKTPFYFYHEGIKVCKLDPACVKNLNTLLDKTGAELVICSSWRLNSTPARFTSFLRMQGLTHDVVGFTPNMEWEGRNRDAEVLHYINAEYPLNDIDKWIVIDDLASELQGIDKQNLLIVDHISGFNHAQLEKALNLLS